jgi:hypothetical protein
LRAGLDADRLDTPPLIGSHRVNTPITVPAAQSYAVADRFVGLCLRGEEHRAGLIGQVAGLAQKPYDSRK